MHDKFEPIRIFISAFGIASLGGLAALLRSKKELTLRSVSSAILSSGIVGLIIALTWYNYFNKEGNIYFLLGVSALAGIGGMTVTDFVIQLLKNGGINISIAPMEDDKEAEEDDSEQV